MNPDPSSALASLAAILVFGAGWVLARLGVFRGFWQGFWAGFFTRVFVGSLRRRRGGVFRGVFWVSTLGLVAAAAVRACALTGG
jgi:hypothetical protein